MYTSESIPILRRPRSFCGQACGLFIFVATFLDLMNIALSARMSGLYIDNGYDQTVVHRVVSQREKREVEHEILNLLGLPDRPRSIIGKTPQRRRSAPKFLLDIYENALGENDDTKSPLTSGNHHRNPESGEFDFTGQDLRAIDQSDVIMTFAAHSKSLDPNFHFIIQSIKKKLTEFRETFHTDFSCLFFRVDRFVDNSP